MRNVVAVVTITVACVAALALAGGSGRGGGDGISRAGAPAEEAAVPRAPRWEYRVVSTRTARAQVTPRAGRAGGGDPNVRFVARSAVAEAETLAAVERELNRLGGEGWEMCSAADGTMVFRRAN